MGILGAVRTRSDQVEKPLHECDELWINPDFPIRARWWSWRDLPKLVADDIPGPTRLDGLIGCHIVFETAQLKAVWRVVAVDNVAGLVLARWPD